MDKLVTRLEDKWGKFEKDKEYLKQCDMSSGRKKSYLNVLFNPQKPKVYEKVEQALGCKLLPELKEFYKKYNGIMLFFESLRIYGVELNSKAIYDSCDIIMQNKYYDADCLEGKFPNMIAFGYYSSGLFCYDKTKMDKIYVIDKKTNKIAHEFKTITELLNYYVDYLIKEYDATGKKIHINPKYEGLPMANMSIEFI